MTAAKLYSPEPNILERKFADHLAQRGTAQDKGVFASRSRVQGISRITRWTIGLSALAGIVSGGLIGGAEVWLREVVLAGSDAVWQETMHYWAAFYAFVGVVSAIEIALLYLMTLRGIARLTRHSGLRFARGDDGGLLSHSLARAGLEFPNPQVHVYGIDPYAYVWNWKLTALNIAYKLKVGVSSFILRVFLSRVAARVAIRGMIPLFAGPLYAAWNAYIVWRIMTEAQLRALGPLAVDNVIKTHFQLLAEWDETAKNVILHATGEMLTHGRDAHPNQIYLLTQLRAALDHDAPITLDWADMRQDLPTLDAARQTILLDSLTLSCVIGTRMHHGQMKLLESVCHDCGANLHKDRLRDLRKALKKGQEVDGTALASTRSDMASHPLM